MVKSPRIRNRSLAEGPLFRRGRGRIVLRRHSFLRLSFSLGHTFPSASGGDIEVPGHFRRIGGGPVLPPRYVLLPVARRRGHLVSGRVRQLWSERHSTASE